MPFTSMTRIVCLMSVAAASGGPLAAAEPVPASCTCATEVSDRNFPSEASQLLQEIRSAAHRLSVHAATVASFRRGGVSWEGHANELTLIREQINAVGERIQRLHAIRHATAPWQQEAIDSVTPMAATLGSRTKAAIRHLNDNRNYLWSETYQEHLNAISSRADQMKESVGLQLELAETQDKLEALRGKLASIGS